jgi:hypothetical protein
MQDDRPRPAAETVDAAPRAGGVTYPETLRNSPLTVHRRCGHEAIAGIWVCDGPQWRHFVILAIPRFPSQPSAVSGRRGIRGQHQGACGLWAQQSPAAPRHAAIRPGPLFSARQWTRWAARAAAHQGNLFTILLGTWSAPASTPRFVVARRTNCRFTAPYSSRAPGKKGKVWRCGLKDGRREGIGS